MGVVACCLLSRLLGCSLCAVGASKGMSVLLQFVWCLVHLGCWFAFLPPDRRCDGSGLQRQPD